MKETFAFNLQLRLWKQTITEGQKQDMQAGTVKQTMFTVGVDKDHVIITTPN